jgi:hypothetical protein
MIKIVDKFPFKEKAVWLDYLEQGKFSFPPHDVQQFTQDLHQSITKIIKENPPSERFKRLLKPRRVTRFKVTEDGNPLDPELALERFVIVSNPNNLTSNNFFNQVAIDSRERIDIVIEESDTECVFAELKGWHSVDNPLYAITENIKNLIKCRTIQGKITMFDNIDLMILAPEAYYWEYGLIEGNKKEQRIRALKTLLSYLSVEFRTNISFWCLQIKKEDFFDKCCCVYNTYGIREEHSVHLSDEEKDTFPVLARHRWLQLVGTI